MYLSHAGKTYPLFGPKELDQYEIAEILTQALGKKITYVPMEIEAFQEMLKAMGFTPHFQQHMGHVAEDCRNGVFSGMNDLVETVTGQKPLGMMDYIVKNKAAFSQTVTARVA
jgi:NAD(P)H dehydrogenase (quinone)